MLDNPFSEEIFPDIYKYMAFIFSQYPKEDPKLLQ